MPNTMRAISKVLEVLGPLLLACLTPGCGSQSLPDPTPRPAAADIFALDAATREAAPAIQAQLYDLVRYAGPTFEVKPAFVFIDQGIKIEGRLDIQVTAYCFIHFAYYTPSGLDYEASVVFPPAQGLALSSREGFSLDVIPDNGNYRVVFGGPSPFETLMPVARQATWLEKDGRRLFVYLFPFPDQSTGAVRQ